MTKADIAERVRDTLGNQKKDALDLVESVLDILKDTLESGEEVKIAHASGISRFARKATVRGGTPKPGRL